MISYGLLMYKINNQQLLVLLVHPGGPYFKNKQQGYWTIPKGLPLKSEEGLSTAQREFMEETGINPKPPFIDLEEVKQRGGKIVHAWAFENNIEVAQIFSNNFKLEWTPHSGKYQFFLEVDKAAFFTLEEAKQKVNLAQVEFLLRLEKIIL